MALGIHPHFVLRRLVWLDFPHSKAAVGKGTCARIALLDLTLWESLSLYCCVILISASRVCCEWIVEGCYWVCCNHPPVSPWLGHSQGRTITACSPCASVNIGLEWLPDSFWESWRGSGLWCGKRTGQLGPQNDHQQNLVDFWYRKKT